MTADPRRVKELFVAALELPDAPARQAYLDRECGSEADLRHRLDVLLRAHDDPASVLDRPLAEVAPPEPDATGIERPSQLRAVEASPDPETVGMLLAGKYKLLELIGEGGMGTVWMARQTEPVKRLVAVKLIKAGMDSRQVIARFEAERQALALMDHANIARVLDAGTTGAGRPYFVMDLVRGVPITRYCDEHHLTPRHRLELFVPVCSAVQHAHQKGIIHRDLKPSNVLVARYDGKPVPKVIDFGVAKAAGQSLTDKTLVTGFGAIVGTLEYMSPEQAVFNQLDIDTRSDIYSLGVLLYELLTGSPPFTRKESEKGGMLEMLRVIREQEPTKPSAKLSTTDGLATLAANRGTEPAKLTKLVRGELDWIVMKALEKDRSRRYETANAFALDVQRYLADEPVLACPPSAGYRLRKFARRNRSGLAVAGLVLFFLVLLGSGAGWAWRDRAARQAEQASNLERAVERAELLQQEGKRGEALAAFERATLLARESEPSPPLRKRIDSLQGSLDAEGQDLDLVARFEAIRREEQTEVDVEKNTFRTEKGYPKLREALKQYGIEVAVTPPDDAAARIQGRPPAFQKVVISALDECLLFVPGVDPRTRQWYLKVLQKADGDPWRREVRKAWRNPSELERLVKDVNVSRHPANFLVMTISALPAQSPSRLDLARRVQRAYPDDFWANNRLGNDLKTSGKPLEAIHYHTAALALQPRNPGSYLNRSIAFEASKDLTQALADINQAIDLAPRYAIAWRIKGRLLQKMNDMENAEAALRQALVLNPRDGSARSLLAGQFKKAGRHREWEVELRQAIALDPKDALAHYNYGNDLLDQWKLDEAIACYRKAIELDPQYAPAHHNLGWALFNTSRLEKAIKHYRKAIELDPKLAVAHSHLGLALHRQNRLDEAIACYKRAIELEPESSLFHDGLGGALVAKGMLDEAVACYKRALELEPCAHGARQRLGEVLQKQGKLDEAVALYHQGLDLGPDTGKAFHWLLRAALQQHVKPDEAIARYRKRIELRPDDASSHWGLGLLLEKQGKLDEATACYRRAVELKPREFDFCYSLGAALYKAGRWKEAIETLERADQLLGGKLGTTFFIAMAHWQLGNKEEARKWYDRATEWMDKNHGKNEELRRLRAEAAELMKVKQKKD